MKYFVFKTNSLISQNNYFLKFKSHAFTLVLYKKKKASFPAICSIFSNGSSFYKTDGPDNRVTSDKNIYMYPYYE